LTYDAATKKWIAADSQGGGGGGTLDQWARNQANAAFLQANTPSYVANSAASYANSAFITANNASSNTVIIQGVNLTQNTNITNAWDTANAAFVQANTPSYVANSAASYANSAFIHANAAFNYANTLPTTLDGLTDVTITGPTNDQVLTYNTALGQWINAAATSISQNAATGYYGSFYDMNTQRVATGGANAAMMFATTAESNGVIIDSGANTHVKFLYSGTYNIQFSSQFHNTGGGGSGTIVTIWGALNGTNLANTGGNITVNTNSPYVIASWNYILTVNAGDYFELYWLADNQNIVMEAIQPDSTPGIPSVILTAQQVTNVVASNVQFAYTQANSAFNTANSAFTVANNAFTTTNGSIAWATANSAGSYANAAFLKANTPDHVGNSASSYANSAFLVANSAFTSANGTIAWNTANASFLQANTPSHVANSAASYANAAFTQANTAITTSGGSITGRLNVTYAPATTVGATLNLFAANTQGGTGYADFLKVTNNSGGATNSSKSFRLSSAGAVEVINNAYSATLMSLSDTGSMSTALPYQVAGKQAVNGPAFSAYAEATLQTIPNGSLTKVLFQTEEFDTNSNYASSRFTPTVEGYYQLNAEVRLDGASGTGEMMIVLYKNGSAYKRGTNQQGTQIAANFWAMQVSSVVYANGVDDYFEIYVQQGSGGTVSVTAVNSPAITWFNGCMLRGA
jgi:hypothetical protein